MTVETIHSGHPFRNVHPEIYWSVSSSAFNPDVAYYAWVRRRFNSANAHSVA